MPNHKSADDNQIKKCGCKNDFIVRPDALPFLLYAMDIQSYFFHNTFLYISRSKLTGS
jgi:hypothetical protein